MRDTSVLEEVAKPIWLFVQVLSYVFEYLAANKVVAAALVEPVDFAPEKAYRRFKFEDDFHELASSRRTPTESPRDQPSPP